MNAIVSGGAKIAGVMGWPIGHSLSPRLHNYWLAEQRIDGAYVPFPVAPDNLAQALRALPSLGIAGVNLTVPHKEMALDIVDEADPLARRIGSVNTIVVSSDSQLIGLSTDGFGFLENLRSVAPDWAAADGPAVILGAGGAARAISFALLDTGAPNIVIVNRTSARAEALAADLNAGVPSKIASVVAWSERAEILQGAALLVNTTSLGMTGQPELELSLDELPRGALVNDIVYSPLETPLLAAARAHGCRTVDGLGMLLHQARPAFKAWFDVDPEVTPALRRYMLLARD